MYKSFNSAYANYDYNSCIKHSLKIIELSKIGKDDYNLSNGYNNLGIVSEVLEDSARARENYQKSLEYALKVGNDTLLLNAYNNLGNIYSQNNKTLSKGIEYYRKAVNIASARLSPEAAINPVVNIGWTYLENKDYDKSFHTCSRHGNCFGS